MVLRAVLQKGRNVALKRANPRKGRFKEEIGRRRGPGRKGGGGGRFTKPSPLQVVIARRWVGEPSTLRPFNTRRWVGAFQKCDNVGLERDGNPTRTVGHM